MKQFDNINLLVLCLSPGKGGLEIYAAKSLSFFTDLGTRCLSVCLPDCYLSSENKKKNIPCETLKKKFYIFPVFAAIKLARLCEQHDIDIIQIHWSNDFNLAVLAKIFCKKSIKIIYMRQMAITRYKHDIYHRFLYRHVDRFVVISQNLYQQAKRFLPLDESKLRLIYHGVTTPQEKTRSCSELFSQSLTSSSQLHIGLFGRIEYGKGQHLIIDAVKKLKARNKIVTVSLIGQVMSKKYFASLQRTIEREGLSSQIKHYPFIDNAASYMCCFDVISLTTYDETFGLVVIEAMCSGVAVIGSDAGGVPEIIENDISGLLFESGNADALTEKIELLYDDVDLRTKIAKAGQQRALENFSEQRHIEALSKIIIDVHSEN